MSKNLGKPKILADILPRRAVSVFRKISDPLGRCSASLWEIPKKLRIILIAFITLAVFFVVSNINFSTLAPTALSAPTVLSQSSDEERRNLETELKKIESEIDNYEKIIVDLQNQRRTLNQNIKILDAQINKLNLQIKATNIQLNQLDKEIISLEKNITITEGDIGRVKFLLIGSLRQIYIDDQQSLIEIALKNEKLSDFFNNINALTLLQEQVRRSLDKLIELKTTLVNQKDVLATERQDVLNLKIIQENQKTQLNQKKKEKNDLIRLTKGQESKYQELLRKSKQTAAQIRSRIFELLGGGELTFEEAYKLAQFASEQTGVRAALILAVLDKESNFGRNVGRCNWKTAMHPTRDQPIFLEITKELNINPDSISVSCPNRDGVYGGAMGLMQFLPSTWASYKNKIAAITGNNPPSPWRSIDAFVAAALYLKDLGAAAQTYTAERKAAAMYYAGSRWSRFLYSYGQWVVERASRFEQDIEALKS